jgi:hypothetical protein
LTMVRKRKDGDVLCLCGWQRVGHCGGAEVGVFCETALEVEKLPAQRRIIFHPSTAVTTLGSTS